MQFCDKCGQGNADDSGFCMQCGAPLTGARQAQAGGGAPPEGPIGSMPPGGTVPPPPGVAAPPPGMPPAPGAAAPPPGVQQQWGPPGGAPPPGTVPPPGYGPPYAVRARTDGLAVASLVAGIAGFFVCPVVAGVLAIIFGYMAKSNIERSGGALEGDSLATWGIVLGFIQLGLLVVTVIIIVIIVAVADTSSSSLLIAPALVSTLALL